jgi:hypothetical protein
MTPMIQKILFILVPHPCEVVVLAQHVIDALAAHGAPDHRTAAPNAVIGPDITVLAIRPAH